MSGNVLEMPWWVTHGYCLGNGYNTARIYGVQSSQNITHAHFFLVSESKIVEKQKTNKQTNPKTTQKTFDRGYMSDDSFAGIHL